MPRIALGLEYDGSGFCGWQSQQHGRGVQECVERALSFVADHPVRVQAAGRTDTGVHAAIQVVHFDTGAVRGERGWMLGANTHLPDGVSVLWAREVAPEFHARFSAISRTYRYVILNRLARPGLMRGRVSWHRYPLDHELMQAAAQTLVGQHDFTSFRASECQSHSPVRRMYVVDVQRSHDVITVTISANAFLHHMVRNIVGVLLAIGQQERPVEWCAEVLAARDRTLGGVTAPPDGLYLASIRYPSEWSLPSEPAVFHPLSGFPRLPAELRRPES
jgi:tRNA pseudouridine38-40 synthase